MDITTLPLLAACDSEAAALLSSLVSVHCFEGPLITTRLRPSLSSGTNCGGRVSLGLLTLNPAIVLEDCLLSLELKSHGTTSILFALGCKKILVVDAWEGRKIIFVTPSFGGGAIGTGLEPGLCGKGSFGT